ncbi:MAG: hypothetical protein ACE5HH_04935, partial [Candidatus Hydrothermarchaeales archaeon]
MNFRSFILLMALLMLLPQVAAQEISYDIIISLSEDSVHETLKITVNNDGELPLEDFSYELPGDAKDIKVYDALGNLSPEIVYGANVVINSEFRAPVQPGEKEVITIEFNTAELISFNGEEYIFSALFSPPARYTKKFLLRLELPRGMGLPTPISSGARTDIAPLPDETISDGTTTTFVWDVKPGDDFAAFVRYMPLIPVSTSPPSTPAPSTSVWSRGYLLIVPVLLAVLLGAYYFKRKKEKVKEKTEFMKDDEKTIIELIRANEGIVQKRL